MSEVTTGRRNAITKAFWEFHNTNPKVYARLAELALQAKRTGRPRIGIKMLFEVLRWEHFLDVKSKDFKLNNNFHSRYARLLMRDYPQLQGFFETRELH